MRPMAAVLLFLLPAACGTVWTEDLDFEGEPIPPSSTPAPPEDITVRAQSSMTGILRVSKVLRSTPPQVAEKKAQPDSPSKEPPEKATWSLSLVVEGSGADGEDSIHQDSGYTVIDGVRFDNPAQIDVSWEIREMTATFLVSTILPSGIEFSGGFGYGQASLDLHYTASYTQVLINKTQEFHEHLRLGGFDMKLGVGWHATPWLEMAVRLGVLFDAPLLGTYDGLVIVRPWSVFGLIAGWRGWTYSNDTRDNSALFVNMSSPLFGLVLEF